MRQISSTVDWRRHHALPVAILLLIHAGLLAWGAVVHSPTVDEPMHLAAGIYRWHFGRFDLDRGSPPLAGSIAACPVLAARPRTDWRNVPHSFSVCVDFLVANGLRTCSLVMLGRWALIPVSLVGGYVCYRWARELYGCASGLMALTLWCFSPNIIAHAQLITADLSASAMGITAFYAFWRWLSQPTWHWALAGGMLLGLAELTKFVWVILYVLWPALWILWRLRSRSEPGRPSFRVELWQLVVLILLSVYVINLGYGFERPGVRLDRLETGRRLLAGLAGSDSGREASPIVKWIGRIPVPLPENYLLGIDEIAALHERPRATYLRRQWREGGYWFYYPYALLVKVPLGTLALVALAGGMSFLGRFRGLNRTELFLLLSFVAVLGFVTEFGTSQRLRYALPVLPLVFVWSSKCGRAFSERGLVFAPTVAAALAASTLSSLWTYPHSLSYFNELAGGPRRGHAHLLESNIDWGQDFLYLKRWLCDHPEAKPLGLAWRHPLCDPRVFEIDYTDVPAGVAIGRSYRPELLASLGPQPGWYAVNVDRLRGGGGELAYFFCFEPTAMAGYSLYIYHITWENAQRVRTQLGLPELASED